MKNYIKHAITTYLNSFKQWKTILLTTAYDLTFWAIFFIITYLIGLPLKAETAILQKINFNQQALFTTGAAQINNTLIKTFVTKVIIITIIYTAVLLLAYTLMKALIWTTIQDKKINKKYTTNFLKLNAIWWAILLIPILFTLLGAQPEWRNYLAIALAVLYFHFTTTLQAKYTQTESIKKAYEALTTTGITKIHHFIIPYTLTTLTYLALTRILYITPKGTIMLATAIIILMLTIAWFRTYTNQIITKLE